MIEALILMAFLLIVGWLSYFISKKIFLLLKKKENKYAEAIQIVVALGIFFGLCFLAAFMLYSGAEMDRG